jgi:hypothetical protein
MISNGLKWDHRITSFCNRKGIKEKGKKKTRKVKGEGKTK